MENEDLQMVIHGQNKDDEVDNDDMEIEKCTNNHNDYNDRKEDAHDVDVHRDDLWLNSVNGVDDEG